MQGAEWLQKKMNGGWALISFLEKELDQAATATTRELMQPGIGAVQRLLDIAEHRRQWLLQDMAFPIDISEIEDLAEVASLSKWAWPFIVHPLTTLNAQNGCKPAHSYRPAGIHSTSHEQLGHLSPNIVKHIIR